MTQKSGKQIFKKSIFFITKPATGGIISLFFGVICVILIIAGLIFSYANGGNAGKIVGSLALTALLLACFGLFFAFRGFKEENKSYLPCKVGVIWCGCVAVFVIFLFFTGL